MFAAVARSASGDDHASLVESADGGMHKSLVKAVSDHVASIAVQELAVQTLQYSMLLKLEHLAYAIIAIRCSKPFIEYAAKQLTGTGKQLSVITGTNDFITPLLLKFMGGKEAILGSHRLPDAVSVVKLLALGRALALVRRSWYFTPSVTRSGFNLFFEGPAGAVHGLTVSKLFAALTGGSDSYADEANVRLLQGLAVFGAVGARWDVALEGVRPRYRGTTPAAMYLLLARKAVADAKGLNSLPSPHAALEDVVGDSEEVPHARGRRVSKRKAVDEDVAVDTGEGSQAGGGDGGDAEGKKGGGDGDGGEVDGDGGDGDHADSESEGAKKAAKKAEKAAKKAENAAKKAEKAGKKAKKAKKAEEAEEAVAKEPGKLLHALVWCRLLIFVWFCCRHGVSCNNQ